MAAPHICTVKIKQFIYNMSIKHFIILLLALTSTYRAFSQCENMPAPANLTNTVNIPGYLAFTFDPVPLAVGYEARVTNLSNNIMQQFSLPPVATSFEVFTTPGNHLVELVALCEPGVQSPNEATLIVLQENLIVVDLVVSVAPNNSSQGTIHCEHGGLTATTSCITLPLSSAGEYGFEFIAESQLYKGLIYKNLVQTSPHLKIDPTESANGSWSAFQAAPQMVHINQGGAYNAETPFVRITSNDQNMYFITNSRGTFRNFKIYQCSGGQGGGLPGDQRSNPDETTGANASMAVAPNPFTNALRVDMNQPVTGDVNIRMIDITGSIQKSCT